MPAARSPVALPKTEDATPASGRALRSSAAPTASKVSISKPPFKVSTSKLPSKAPIPLAKPASRAAATKPTKSSSAKLATRLSSAKPVPKASSSKPTASKAPATRTKASKPVPSADTFPRSATQRILSCESVTNIITDYLRPDEGCLGDNKRDNPFEDLYNLSRARLAWCRPAQRAIFRKITLTAGAHQPAHPATLLKFFKKRPVLACHVEEVRVSQSVDATKPEKTDLWLLTHGKVVGDALDILVQKGAPVRVFRLETDIHEGGGIYFSWSDMTRVLSRAIAGLVTLKTTREVYLSGISRLPVNLPALCVGVEVLHALNCTFDGEGIQKPLPTKLQNPVAVIQKASEEVVRLDELNLGLWDGVFAGVVTNSSAALLKPVNGEAFRNLTSFRLDNTLAQSNVGISFLVDSMPALRDASLTLAWKTGQHVDEPFIIDFGPLENLDIVELTVWFRYETNDAHDLDIAIPAFAEFLSRTLATLDKSMTGKDSKKHAPRKQIVVRLSGEFGEKSLSAHFEGVSKVMQVLYQKSKNKLKHIDLVLNHLLNDGDPEWTEMEKVCAWGVRNAIVRVSRDGVGEDAGDELDSLSGGVDGEDTEIEEELE